MEMQDRVLRWLLELDNPSARYLALRHLLGRPEGDGDVMAARVAITSMTPVRAILNAAYPAGEAPPGGYWIKPDRGYSPRHKATIWQLIFLADLGAPLTPEIARACEHILAHAVHPGSSLFSAHKHSMGIYPCLNGDLLRTFNHFAYEYHSTIQAVAQALALRTIKDGFICPQNGSQPRDKRTWQPCVWGCVRVLRGLAAIPAGQRTPEVCRAAEQGIAFLLDRDLTQDQHPIQTKADSHWLHLGFPDGYGSDLLEALLALREWDAACPENAIQVVLSRQDVEGRWLLDYAPPRMWANLGAVGAPDKWVTLRALQVLDAM